MRYEVAYVVGNTHATITLDLKRPFESDAIEAMLRQGSLSRDDINIRGVVIKSIKPA